tara:strand:+ start:6216 stop:6359 length:144 start_codon:yes stop_codon:yes gene_type:complete
MKKENLYKLIVVIVMGIIGYYVNAQDNMDKAQWAAIGKLRTLHETPR